MSMTDERDCCAPYDAMSSYWCRCHEMMGNDFYFLPANTCLGNKPEPMRGGYEFPDRPEVVQGSVTVSFPDRPLMPTKVAVFDDSELAFCTGSCMSRGCNCAARKKAALAYAYGDRRPHLCWWTVGLVALAFVIVGMCIVYDFLPKGFRL